MMTTQRKNRLRRIIQESRARLLSTQPYFAMLLMYLRFFAVTDIKKISTNGRSVCFAAAFLEKLHWYEVDYVLCHVLLHILNDDIYREQELEDDDYHYCCDRLINTELLVARGFGEHSKYPHLGTLDSYPVEDFALLDDLSPEEAVEKMPFSLYVMTEKRRSRMFADSDAYWGRAETEINGELILDIPEMYARMFENKSLAEGWGDASAAAAGATGKSASQLFGNDPGHMQRIINKLREPSLDWKRILNEFIQEQVSDYSFSPPDRRFSETDFFLPDFNQTDFSVKGILFLVDTSGSVDDETLAAVYSEIKGAVEQFDGKLSAKLGFFDTEVFEPVPFENVNELLEIVPVGYGGTSFEAVFDWLRKECADDLPSSLIIFTDGYSNYPAESAAMGVPVLWMIDNKDITPPWGKVTRVLIDKDK